MDVTRTNWTRDTYTTSPTGQNETVVGGIDLRGSLAPEHTSSAPTLSSEVHGSVKHATTRGQWTEVSRVSIVELVTIFEGFELRSRPGTNNDARAQTLLPHIDTYNLASS